MYSSLTARPDYNTKSQLTQLGTNQLVPQIRCDLFQPTTYSTEEHKTQL